MSELITEIDMVSSTGTDNWYKHSLTGYKSTDGVMHIAEKGGLHWLIDAILISIRHHGNMAQMASQGEMFFCTLTIKKSKADLIITRENPETGKNIIEYKQHFYHTDAKIEGDKIKMWFRGGILLMPSEY